MNIDIGEKIRKLRQQRGEKQSSLALFLGVSVQCVSKWERKISVPDIGLLPSIAAYYNITIDELFNVYDINKENEYKRDIEALRVIIDEKRWLDEAKTSITLLRRYPAKTELYLYLLDGVIRSVISETAIPDEIIEKAICFGEKAFRQADDISQKMQLARQLAVLLYCKKRVAEADKYYNMLVDAKYSRETLVAWKYNGKERREKLFENVALFSAMLADAYTKLAYNTEVSDNVAEWLMKAVNLYEEAYAANKEESYFKVSNLIMFDIFCTYSMMGENEKAYVALEEAWQFAEKHGVINEYIKIVINHSERKPQMWERPELTLYLDKIKKMKL